MIGPGPLLPLALSWPPVLAPCPSPLLLRHSLPGEGDEGGLDDASAQAQDQMERGLCAHTQPGQWVRGDGSHMRRLTGFAGKHAMEFQPMTTPYSQPGASSL